MKRIFMLLLSLCVILGGTSVSARTDDMPAHPYHDDISPFWASGGNYSTHAFIVGKAIDSLSRSLAHYPLMGHTDQMISGSEWPDSTMGETDLGTFQGHFYDPDTGLNYMGNSTTAKGRMASWYQLAVREYNNQNKEIALHYLGRALHYAADLSQPHHASNLTALNSNHVDYEDWVTKNQQNYAVDYIGISSLTWAENTSIYDMGHNFAVHAKAQSYLAQNSNTYAQATSNTLPKAQRNCAAVIYKFMIDTGLTK